MKNILVILAVFILSANISFAIDSNYKLNLSKINYVSDNTLEFDIYLINTSNSRDNLKYSAGQYFLNFNPKIANGGTLTYTLIESDLPEALRPRNPMIKEDILRLASNSISQDKGSLPAISGNSPGMLIVRMRLQTSADKFSSEPINLNWTDNTNLFKTKIFAFDGKMNVDITGSTDIAGEGVSGERGVEEITTSIPTEYALDQNYPNPFNPETKINFDIKLAGPVTLKVYDLTGKEIASLVNENLEPGRYTADFNGANFASGLYFYKITAGDYSSVKKMVLIK